jgi:hypothetical protein
VAALDALVALLVELVAESVHCRLHQPPAQVSRSAFGHRAAEVDVA